MEFVKRQQYSQQWLIQLPATYQIFFLKAYPAFVNANAGKHFKESSLSSLGNDTHAHGFSRRKSPPLRIRCGCGRDQWMVGVDS